MAEIVFLAAWWAVFLAAAGPLVGWQARPARRRERERGGPLDPSLLALLARGVRCRDRLGTPGPPRGA